MKIAGRSYRTIWTDPATPGAVFAIDQRRLPHRFEVLTLRTVSEAAEAIRHMAVRGAPLLGATAAWGMYLAALAADDEHLDAALEEAARALIATRPTARDLEWAVRRQLARFRTAGPGVDRRPALAEHAARLCDESVEACRRIGENGATLIEEAHRRTGRAVNVLTHCNAGWLACVDFGTATAPVYLAHDRGIPVHVWVDETRPRNQGAALTAWELGQHGVPHTLIVDNAGGHLMQHGRVDLVLVGADRITRRGDAANKIGTYLKALAARDNGVPFYVAAPASTFDPALRDGVREIPIEERHPDEVRLVHGRAAAEMGAVLVCPESTPAANPAFDVTPARLITGFVTERGIAPPTEEGLLRLFPEWEGPGEAAHAGRPSEGYVKFEVRRMAGPAPSHPDLGRLEAARTRLWDAGLLGITPDGIGFGNVSVRDAGEESFVITGTATGGARRLGADGYTRVTAFDLERNAVWCTGPVKASAETMTHGVLYRADRRIRCVIHVHSRRLWNEGLAAGWPATPREAEYGTPELARALGALAARRGADRGLVVLGGHEDGVIAYGPDIATAEEQLPP